MALAVEKLEPHNDKVPQEVQDVILQLEKVAYANKLWLGCIFLGTEQGRGLIFPAREAKYNLEVIDSLLEYLPKCREHWQKAAEEVIQ